MRTAGIGAAAAGLIAGCTNPSKPAATPPPAAPQNACMEIMSPPGQPSAKLRAIAYDTPNIETCGMYVEGLRLERGRDAWGVWNGLYVYADARGIDAQSDLKSNRYAIYQADKRAELDQGLQQEIAEQKKARAASSRPKP
jgi:hypothetical protein